MVIYEVNLAVEQTHQEAFAQWLGPHIEEMLAFAGFVEATWWRRRPEDEDAQDDHCLWTVHYKVETRDALEAYFSQHAARMRDDGMRRFGGHFSASRRILEEPRTFS